MHINQVFTSIQGEGPSIGQPCLFVRVNGCNLSCPFCDTKYASKNNDDTISKQDLIAKINHEQQIYPGIHLAVITGGEPFLRKNELELIIDFLKKENFNSIEIETNGTKIEEEFLNQINANITLNISPKLRSECWHNTHTKQQIQVEYKRLIEMLSWTNFQFNLKFVHSNEDEELIKDFIFKTVYNTNFNDFDIYCMAKTPNMNKYQNQIEFLDDFNTACLKTVEFCKQYNFIYSPREHVALFGTDKNEMT